MHSRPVPVHCVLPGVSAGALVCFPGVSAVHSHVCSLAWLAADRSAWRALLASGQPPPAFRARLHYGGYSYIHTYIPIQPVRVCVGSK